MAEQDGLRYTLHKCHFAPLDYAVPMHPCIIPKTGQTLYIAVGCVWTTKTRRLHLRAQGSVGSSRCHLQSCAANLGLPQAIKAVENAVVIRDSLCFATHVDSTVMADRIWRPRAVSCRCRIQRRCVRILIGRLKAKRERYRATLGAR